MSKDTSQNSLDLLNSCKDNGWMKIENPEKLSAQLTARYGDKAPDLIMEAVNNPSGLMKKIGQEPTTSTNALNYLVSDDISKENITKLGGTVEQVSPGFTLEPVEEGVIQPNTASVSSPDTALTEPDITEQPDSTNLSQVGNVDVYGNQLNNPDSNSSTPSSAKDNTDNDPNTPNENKTIGDLWSDFFSNLLSGDFAGATLALQMLNQAHLAFAPHYCPFPLHHHPYQDRIDHFDHCVDNRSKTEKTLDRISDVAHATGHILGATGHLIDAINGKHRGMG